MSWTNESDKVFIWHETARTMAIRQGVLRESGRDDDVFEDDAYMTLFAQFLDASGQSLVDWETGKGALFDWGNWLQGDTIKPRNEGQIFHATITKIYGGVHVTFGYQGVFDVPEHQSHGAYLYCLSMVNQQFKRFEANGLAQSQPPATAGRDQRGHGTATFTSESLVIEDKGDGIYYKIKGAQYKKFGVRVWPEVLKEAGVEFEGLRAGSYPLERKCVVEISEGKARKVLEIE